MIECKEIVKTFGAHTAVDHLSFRLEKGKIYGFLGPNGAGKSTTMNMMTGYLAPTSGEITINGYDMLKDPEKAKAYIGYLPEIPPLYNDMTVEEYLEFVAELKKIPSKKRRDEVASAEDVNRNLCRSFDSSSFQRISTKSGAGAGTSGRSGDHYTG